MKTQMMAAGLLLAISSLGLAAEQCKVQSVFKDVDVVSAAIDSSRNTIYFTDDYGTDKIHALNLETGKTEVLDLGPEWKYQIETITSGTGSYLYAVGNYRSTKEVKVDDEGRTNVYSSVFKIAKHDGQVVDMLKIWQRYDDGDESGFGDIQFDQGDDRLYVALEDEGSYGALYAINTNTMKIMKGESERLDKQIEAVDLYSSFSGTTLDDEQGVIYKADQGQLHAFGAEGQDMESFQLALSDESPALAYDRTDNSLLMSYESYESDVSQAIVGRLSLEGEVIASHVIDQLSQPRSGVTKLFATTDENKVLVLGYQYSAETNKYSGLLLEVNLEAGTAQALCE